MHHATHPHIHTEFSQCLRIDPVEPRPRTRHDPHACRQQLNQFPVPRSHRAARVPKWPYGRREVPPCLFLQMPFERLALEGGGGGVDDFVLGGELGVEHAVVTNRVAEVEDDGFVGDDAVDGSGGGGGGAGSGSVDVLPGGGAVVEGFGARTHVPRKKEKKDDDDDDDDEVVVVFETRDVDSGINKQNAASARSYIPRSSSYLFPPPLTLPSLARFIPRCLLSLTCFLLLTSRLSCSGIPCCVRKDK